MNRFAKWFNGPTDADLKVELSRLRFVHAGVPGSPWAEIQAEYRHIMALRAAVAD